MKKLILLSIICVSIGFSYGVRPSFSLGVNWSYMKPEGYDGAHFLGPGIEMTAPFNRYIGLTAGFFWVDFDLSEEGTMLGLNSRVGFIEMIPTKVVSPYFTEHITLDVLTSGGYTFSTLGLGASIGIEFLSSSYISPYLYGAFAYENTSFDGSSSHILGFGAGFGVRFSWVK